MSTNGDIITLRRCTKLRYVCVCMCVYVAKNPHYHMNVFTLLRGRYHMSIFTSLRRPSVYSRRTKPRAAESRRRLYVRVSLPYRHIPPNHEIISGPRQVAPSLLSRLTKSHNTFISPKTMCGIHIWDPKSRRYIHVVVHVSLHRIALSRAFRFTKPIRLFRHILVNSVAPVVFQ
jgi:hypothetical protein